MTSIFKANNPYNNFLLFAYGFLLKLPMFIFPAAPVSSGKDTFLYQAVLSFLHLLSGSGKLLYSIIAFCLLYIQAISLNRLVNDLRLLPKTNYLTGMSYLLISSLFGDWLVFSAPLLILTLLIPMLSALCNLYNSPNGKTSVFNIGMLTGLATLFYLPSIVFLLLVIIGLIVTRPFRLAEWFIVFIGFFSSWYFIASWLFLTDTWQHYSFPYAIISLPAFSKSVFTWIAASLTLFSVILGMFFVRRNIQRLLLQSRKCWTLLLVFLITTVLSSFLNVDPGFAHWIPAVVPAASFAAAAFLFPEKKWYAIIMHWGMVAVAIATGYLSL